MMLTPDQREAVLSAPFHPSAHGITPEMEQIIGKNMLETSPSPIKPNEINLFVSEAQMFILKQLTDEPQTTRQIKESTNSSAYKLLSRHLSSGYSTKIFKKTGSGQTEALWTRGPRWHLLEVTQ